MARMPEPERLFQMTEIERPLWDAPGCVVAGMDEVGRGPLAGPVVTACVVLEKEPLIYYVNDSKKLSEKRRETVYEEISAKALCVGIGWVEPTVIDEINILEATKLAMVEAFEKIPLPVTDVLVDAVKGLPLRARQHAFVRGDAISYLIAAASIVAKVTRDRYMREMDARYPEYGFARNKGYGTAEHIAAIRQHGPCPIHRRSFIRNFQ